MSGSASLLCLTWLMAAAAALQHECGGLVSGPSGSLAFHRADVQAGLQCLWRVTVPGAKEIVLTFDSLALGRIVKKNMCKQMLTIYSGTNLSKIVVPGGAGPGRHEICGNKKGPLPLPVVRVAGDTALVLLVALRPGEDRGFSLSYAGAKPAVPCPADWTAMGNMCVKVLSGSSRTIDEARTDCLELGADLALPESEEQTQVLLDLWTQDSILMPIGAVRGQGGFVKEDGSPLLWQNWDRGEPNNVGRDENCVHIYKTGKWNDRGCTKSVFHGYATACQKAPDTCQQPTTSSLGAAACDGDWTVVQCRIKNDVLFNQTWSVYQAGFGRSGGDYWVGLDALNELCPPSRPCHLRVDVMFLGQPLLESVPRQPDGRYRSLYGLFAVAADDDLYRLTIGDFNSTASTGGDSLDARYNGTAFSTVDRDNDPWPSVHCSPRYGGGGGWWFIKCGYGLNGRWGAKAGRGMLWPPVTGYESNAVSARMLVLPGA